MRPGAVTFVVFDGFDILDVAGPLEVFGEAGYAHTVVATKAGPVRSDTGLTTHAPSSVSSFDPSRTDTLLVVGGEGVDAARADRGLVDWVRSAAAKVDRVASVCCGAFILAGAGNDAIGTASAWGEVAGSAIQLALNISRMILAGWATLAVLHLVWNRTAPHRQRLLRQSTDGNE